MHYPRKHGKSDLDTVLAIVRKILKMLMLLVYEIKVKTCCLQAKVRKKAEQNNNIPFHDFHHSL